MSDNKVNQFFEEVFAELLDGADEATVSAVDECKAAFASGDHQTAGMQLGMIAARTGKIDLILPRLQSMLASMPATAPLAPLVIPALSPSPASFAYDCYLCKLEARENFHFEGMPPAFDHASKLPVCEEHADEPTSVRVQEFDYKPEVCRICGNEIPPQQPGHSPFENILFDFEGEKFLLTVIPARWEQGEPFALCRPCAVRMCGTIAAQETASPEARDHTNDS